jgi:membrane-associated phospholipid phosphatase
MKSLRYLILFFIVATTASISIVSCDKQLEMEEEFGAITPSSSDADAGTWDMIVLTAPNQIVVPPPVAITSDAYLAELAAIKDAQSKLTDTQREIIAYWSAGGVLRWNQKFRSLVARYNLPPAPRADNTYPAPDAENPFGDPNFPFANPPYAARSYSYVSVAQYEALKAVWHYKYLYGRPSPYATDNGIQRLMPETGLPSYPSEDAAMSGAAAEMMKNMFPAAVEEITRMAAEQRNAALWSGRATSSDITAGLNLGKTVVTAHMLPRAANDGMRTAGGSPALWASLEANVGTGNHTGEQPWISLDNPKRPPMLPSFGLVTGWNMSGQQFRDNRPVAPPSTASGEMATEVAEVKFFSQNLTRERLAIVHKWADGAGTYTPSGHWNDIAAEYVAQAKFSEVRAARAFALLNMAQLDAAIGCWETKFYYFNPRPSQMDRSIKTGTGVPNFPAFTSGHSTFSGSAATVLSYLFPQGAEYFAQEAQEASLSRLYGAIHYRTDIEAGMTHGQLIGGFTVNYAITDGAD